MRLFILYLSIFVFGIFIINAELPSTFAQTGEMYVNDKEVKKVTQVKASHILVPTKGEADKIREEILSGKNFEQAAAESSKCPSGARGGDLGFFGKGQMVQEFEKTAFELPVGEVSQPVQTQFGWHLILVTDKK